MIPNLGMMELLIIGGVLVLIFGPSQLPKLGRSLGQTIKEFRGIGKELHDDEDGRSDLLFLLVVMMCLGGLIGGAYYLDAQRRAENEDRDLAFTNGTADRTVTVSPDYSRWEFSANTPDTTEICRTGGSCIALGMLK